MPAADYSKGERGDGRGRARKPDARTYGQDLMRGEHVVGGGTRVPKQSRGEFQPPAGEYAYPVDQLQEASGTSIFDATLCEAVYSWFSPPGGVVLDPFAGGSVRGVVAAMLGRQYVGVDLSARQVAANREQAERICGEVQPVWHVGDSREIGSIAAGVEADLVFSCPPYADLEVYSDDPADISGMDYPDFLAAYRQIIRATVEMLRPDRFACFVVGEARGRDGYYYGLVPDTVRAFEDAGARYYNEGILVTAVGSLPVRITKQFEGGRKLGKTHQNVLVFCKGDWKKATAACGPVEVYMPEAPDGP